MTEQASTSSTERRTRRQLLAGGTGALAAVLAAQAIARPAPAAADNGGNVILGQANTETSATQISNTADGTAVLQCVATGLGTGVTGLSDSGDGVFGNSPSGAGVSGLSTKGNGVFGGSTHGTGVRGEGTVGVHGVGSGNGTGCKAVAGAVPRWQGSAALGQR